MPAATARYIAEIQHSHHIISYVNITGPDNESARLEAISGDVKVDRSADIRRTCDVECIDSTGDLTPVDGWGILTPYGSEIRPYRGVVYDDGAEEVYPLGVFVVTEVSLTDNANGSVGISVKASDRSFVVKRDKFQTTYVIPSGTNVIQAIRDILARTYDDLSYDTISTTVATTAPQVYDQGADPWDACNTLAQSIGCEIYFDVNGWVVIAPSVDIDDLPAPEFQYIEGNNCAMTDLSRRFSNDQGYNGVIVIGESPGDELPPIRAEAWDDEPGSVTYRKGAYGEVPMFLTSQVVKTQDDATAMAVQTLRNQLGATAQLSINAYVNASYEAGAVVQVERARSHVTGLFAIDAFNVPLRGGTQGITLRQKRRVN